MRPSWQIDLKWALAIAACLLIVASGVLFSLARMTERETAVPLSTAVIAAGIKDRVTDEEFAQVQAAAAADPAAQIALSPATVIVTGAEIAGLSKDDAANLVATKVATVLYDEGPDAAEALLVAPALDAEALGAEVQGDEARPAQKPISLGPAGALTSSLHSRFATYFLIAAASALLLMAFVTLLSRGFGRLGTPMLVLVLGSAPLAALWLALNSAVGPGDADENTFVHAAREAFREASADLRTRFLLLAGFAAAGVGIAVLGALVTWAVNRVQERRSRSDADSDTDIELPPVVITPEAPSFPQSQPVP